MKANMSRIDRIFRALFAVVVAILYFTEVIEGTVGIVLLVVGAILLLTSFINWCPIYAGLGIRTNKKPL